MLHNGPILSVWGQKFRFHLAGAPFSNSTGLKSEHNTQILRTATLQCYGKAWGRTNVPVLPRSITVSLSSPCILQIPAIDDCLGLRPFGEVSLQLVETLPSVDLKAGGRCREFGILMECSTADIRRAIQV